MKESAGCLLGLFRAEGEDLHGYFHAPVLVLHTALPLVADEAYSVVGVHEEAATYEVHGTVL